MKNLSPIRPIKNQILAKSKWKLVKSKGRKQPITIAIRLSVIEKKLIDDRRGFLSVADFLRSSAIGQNIIKKQTHRINPPTVDKDLLRALGHIGNNINQLTLLANTQNQVGSLDLNFINLELATIRQSLDELKQKYTAGDGK